ncbi:hypothetical protein HDU81_009935 [Chytriomyces hyalinus]|nr:hypothetical protein HDU81_009935 [Chytriomyces hyalinus]
MALDHARHVSWSTGNSTNALPPITPDPAIRSVSRLALAAENNASPLLPADQDGSWDRHSYLEDSSDQQNFVSRGLSALSVSQVPRTANGPPAAQDESGSMLLSLRVCTCCQSSLMTVFEHCLSRHREENGEKLDSFHQIDEVADAQQLKSPPYYQVIKDPTIKANAIYEDVAQKVEKDRNVFCETQFIKNLKTKGPTFGNSRFFSGAIYKRTIDAKDREIRHLREKLYEQQIASKIDNQNVKNLKVALNKSMKYYCYAEEWQSQESTRLQQDVRYLKAEMSSLMAFLINSEEEKRMMLLEIKDIRANSKAKDDERGLIEYQRDEYKQKLHESYKEYLATNEIIARLRKEVCFMFDRLFLQFITEFIQAEHGSDTIISRNEVLQRNIDKISRDFETTAKDLASANMRIRDLQFELDEMVQQFNITGQGQKSAEELNVKLAAELEALRSTYNELKHLQTETALRVLNLEKDILDLQELLEVTKVELEQQATDLRGELMTITELKKELEHQLRTARQEVEKLSMALKTLTRSKDQIESAFRVAIQKHEKEIQSREDQISELQHLRTEDALAIRKGQEVKEQLMFQVTDLQNNLDRELSNVNVLSFELSQLKRTSEEKIFNLEEQVEKLTTSKVNLAGDKRTLTEKLRVIRADLAAKEEQLEKITAEYASFKESAASSDSKLKSDLVAINGAHTTLKGEHKTLNQKQAALMETHFELITEKDALLKKVAEMETRHEQSCEEVRILTSKNRNLTQELASSQSDRNEIKIHLDSVLGKLSETTSILNQERFESTSTIQEKTEQLIKMSADLYKVTEDRTRLDSLCLVLQAQVSNLEADLADTKAALAAETLNKEQFEVHLYELRRNLMSERCLRMDFERMHTRIDRRIANKELEKLAAMRARDRKLLEVSKQLQSEHARLENIGALIPTEEFSQTTEAPDIPDFRADGAAISKPKHKKDTKSPDMKVTVSKKE